MSRFYWLRPGDVLSWASISKNQNETFLLRMAMISLTWFQQLSSIVWFSHKDIFSRAKMLSSAIGFFVDLFLQCRVVIWIFLDLFLQCQEVIWIFFGFIRTMPRGNMRKVCQSMSARVPLLATLFRPHSFSGSQRKIQIQNTKWKEKLLRPH